MNFQDARLKLLAYVRNEIRNGELTERRLARLIGISQPHAHNVLKGVRTLSPQVFDLVLKYLHLSLLDLAPTEELEAELDRRRQRPRLAEIPFLASAIGPGLPWPAELDWRKTFPAPLVTVIVPADLRMANLSRDPDMAATLGSYNLALLDVSGHARSRILAEGLYVVERGSEAVARHIRASAHGYHIVADTALDDPAAWEPLNAASIKARVIWLGREDDGGGLQRSRWLYDPISS